MDKPTELPFPLQGVDVGDAYATQRPNSTPVGVNVRGFDPTTDRARGGRRPGLSKYVSERLPP